MSMVGTTPRLNEQNYRVSACSGTTLVTAIFSK